MEDVKKRDLAIDEIDTGSGDEVAATPKKRGRPANPNKPPAKPASGRGRGRPAKNAKKNDDDSDEAGVPNGDKSAPGGRGRPRKAGKLKVVEQIVATGKGRGRPKKSTPSDVEQSDENDDDNDGSSVEEVVHQSPVKKRQKAAAAKPVKKIGRPRKPQASDEESDEEYERQPVGRPATGAINLNIERTGRGQGRPKKNAPKGRMVNSGKRSSDVDEVTVTVPKKRGRPSLGQPPIKPSGKPRGRPKSNVKVVVKSDDEDEAEDEDDEVDDEVEEGKVKNGEKKDADEDAAKTTTAAEAQQIDDSEEEDEDELFLNAEESNGE